MIGRDRHVNGYWKGVLIDYDYALSEKWTDILSPVSPNVWPQSSRDWKFCMSFKDLSDNEKKLQKRILEMLEAGIKVRGHQTVRQLQFFYYK